MRHGRRLELPHLHLWHFPEILLCRQDAGIPSNKPSRCADCGMETVASSVFNEIVRMHHDEHWEYPIAHPVCRSPPGFDRPLRVHFFTGTIPLPAPSHHRLAKVPPILRPSRGLSRLVGNIIHKDIGMGIHIGRFPPFSKCHSPKGRWEVDRDRRFIKRTMIRRGLTTIQGVRMITSCPEDVEIATCWLVKASIHRKIVSPTQPRTLQSFLDLVWVVV